MNLSKPIVISLAIAAILAFAAQAASLSDAQLESLEADCAARTAADRLVGLSGSDGTCTLGKFDVILVKQLGNVVGYRAGLTNPALQQRFSTDRTVWRKLYQTMLQLGDLVSPGSFTARLPARSGQTVAVTYWGLVDAEPVQVIFKSIQPRNRGRNATHTHWEASPGHPGD
jgi:2-keto-4-pentenoate hydratase